MRVPSSTYRIQLNRDFRFEQARALLPYLERIGISDLYASPIFQARKGSMHGYDVTDPTRINSELGTPEEFDVLVRDLDARGMQLLLDIVPNHMAASIDNPWWRDVLENGSASEWAATFDVEWGHKTPTMQEKIVLPILGEPYGTALEDQKLQLSWCGEGLCVRCYETNYPLDPATYYGVLSYRLDELLARLTSDDPGLKDFGLVLERAERLPARNVTDWEALESRGREAVELKRKLKEVVDRYPEVAAFLEENIRRYNGVKGDPDSFNRLDDLLNHQAYQFTYWRAARERINYRRFFDVTDLVSLRAQDSQVFQATHELVLRWLKEHKVSGLRIDHVDGMYEPLAYLSQLQTAAANQAGAPVYVVVEKILSGPESLPCEWPVAGTTGYEFLGAVNNLFVHPQGLQALDGAYSRFVNSHLSFYETAYLQKKKVMEDLFAGEIRTLGLHLNEIASRYRHARDLGRQALNRAILEVTASMPVYRTYTRDFHVTARDRVHIEDAIRSAQARVPEMDAACFAFVRRVLLIELKDDEDALRFVMRWQQLTGPVMAKGVEDTTFYSFNRLISMNDVGGSPEPVSIREFHEFNRARRAHWPAAMNASSTHDTKRSEDVRSRINVLSEIPGEWERYSARWHRWNRTLAGSSFPDQDANQEYLLYQTLLGMWPLDDRITAEFVERVKNYMIKAAREAKVHTSWLHQDGDYEKNMLAFVDAILRENEANRFLPQFRKFVTRAAFYGALNSLAQCVLKMTASGVPDFYQGTTLWDFSLVDPDNRRPAQIAPRLEILESFERWQEAPSHHDLERMLKDWQDGCVKAFVIFKGLHLRKAHPRLFESGEYLGLAGTDLAEEHSVGLARRRGEEWVIAVVPRFAAGFSVREKWPLGPRTWGKAAIRLPEGAPARWTNAFTGETVAGDGQLAMADVLRSFPVAILTEKRT